MPNRLRYRAEAAELMDDFSVGGDELREALRQLRILNRIFALPGPTLYGVKRLWEHANKPTSLSILDIGAGSGEVNRKLLDWADKQGISLTVMLVDVTKEACEEARLVFQQEPRIQIKQGNLFALSEGCADIVTGTQFLHHFSDEELPDAVASMLRTARLGIVINDIHRHWMAWSAVWLVTRIISTNRYILNDGPLSVAKGFRAEDWERLGERLGLKAMRCKWRPLFRYAVVIDKENNSLEQGAE
ncbi:stilbene synthase [Paenibacillus sp. FSL H8-0548]|uniref:methyltransferase domain-containing protein n=1 Tax=Paenibacillus sp. FSL H8-0548 TaxID=1920422 RepID=UPI00096C25E1|nr:methyltransferase domain-containing protein [Paenibacillus sp. FSL H8-0548]OMF22542.1 stilbene synthase [Paenibacillus sp. FSL H8-0548]